MSLNNWIAGGVLLALVSAAGVQTMRLHDAQKNLAQKDAEIARLQRDAEAAGREASERYRSIENELRDTRAAVEAARAAVAASDRDLVDARTAGQRLREQTRVALARRCPAPATPAAPTGDAGRDPLDLFADMQQRLDEAADAVAELADRRGAALNLCVDRYNAAREKIDKALR